MWSVVVTPPTIDNGGNDEKDNGDNLPLLQTIIDESQQAATPSVYLVHPTFHCSLEGLLKREPLDAGDAHSIFCQLAHALQCVHQQGYFHGGVLMNHVVLKKEARGRPTHTQCPQCPVHSVCTVHH